MNLKMVVMVIGLSAVMLSTSGCAALLVGAGAAAGAGGAAYALGDLESEEDVSFDIAYDATTEALEDMGYTITERNRDVEESGVDETDVDLDATIKAEKSTVTIKREVEVDPDDEIDDDEDVVATDEDVETEEENVTVKVASIDGDRTKVSIRIGVFGDEDRARRILAGIRERY